MPLGVHQPLADGDGLEERPGGVFQRGEQEVPQRVVAGHGEAIFERPHERVGGVLREGDEALADVAGGRGVGLFAQHAGAAAADDHGAQGPVVGVQAAEVRQGALQGREGRRGGRVNPKGVGSFAGFIGVRPAGQLAVLARLSCEIKASSNLRALTRYCELGTICVTKAGKPLFDAQLQLFLYPEGET